MDQTLEPTLVGAIRAHRVLVSVIAFLGVAIAIALGTTVLNDYVATSSVLVEDPKVSPVFAQPTTGDPRRYVEDQVAILRSTDLAKRAAELAGDPVSSASGVKELIDSRQISSNPDSDQIEVTVKHKDPVMATSLSDAFIAAYREIRDSKAASGYDAAMDELNASIADVDQELADIDDRIHGATSGEGDETLDQQLQEAIDQLLTLIGRPNPSPDALNSMLQQMQTLQLIQSVQAQDPELATLLSARAETLDRRAQLALRRDQVAVDAALATSGVVLTSSAVEAERSMGLGRLAVLGLLAGLLIGVAVAYNRSLRSRRFEHRYEPELIVDAPLLAEVPDFNREKLTTLIPVRDAPLSASAESFRFAAAAMLGRVDLTSQMSDNGSEASSNGHRLLALTSAWEGDGKTVAVANLGAAVASRGRKVLLVDADFGDQALTKVVSDFLGWHPGLTDVVELGVDLSLAVRAISTGGGLKFDLLARGTQSVSAPEFFRSSETAAFFEKVRELYDLVLVDLPPVLQVAYAGSVLNLCDDVVLVVPHRGDVSALTEAVDRVGLTGSSIVGYIYNKAPLREEMVAKGSSMRDPWGVSEEAQTHH